MMMVKSIQHRFLFFTLLIPFHQGYTPLEKTSFSTLHLSEREKTGMRVFVFDILYLHDPLVPESDADKQCFIYKKISEEGKDDGES